MKDKVLIWHRPLLNQEKSTLTIQAYCDQHHLSAGMFYFVDSATISGMVDVRFPSGIMMGLERSLECIPETSLSVFGPVAQIKSVVDWMHTLDNTPFCGLL